MGSLERNHFIPVHEMISLVLSQNDFVDHYPLVSTSGFTQNTIHFFENTILAEEWRNQRSRELSLDLSTYVWLFRVGHVTFLTHCFYHEELEYELLHVPHVFSIFSEEFGLPLSINAATLVEQPPVDFLLCLRDSDFTFIDFVGFDSWRNKRHDRLADVMHAHRRGTFQYSDCSDVAGTHSWHRNEVDLPSIL